MVVCVGPPHTHMRSMLYIVYNRYITYRINNIMRFVCDWGERWRRRFWGLFNCRRKGGEEEKLMETKHEGAGSEWDDLCWECIAESMAETRVDSVVETRTETRAGRNELFRCARCEMETDMFVNEPWWRRVAVEERSSLQSPLPSPSPLILEV